MFITSQNAAEPRIALVGCGNVGGVHLNRLLREAASIVAVCDPDADALARFAARLPRRPRLFRSEADLLAAGVVDAIVLCTPPDRHARQVRAALDAGVHVLCEKPLALIADEAQALVATARERGLALFASYRLRTRAHALFLLASAGQIGPLTQVTVTTGESWLQRYRGTWRTRSSASGGFIRDSGSSRLDLLLRLVDSPVTDVDAQLLRGGETVDVRASLRLLFRSGVRADVTLVGDSTELVEEIRLFGERGTAGWHIHEDAPAELYLRPRGGPLRHGSPDAHGPSPDAAFVTALRSGRAFGPDTAPDLYDAASTLPVISLIERIHTDAAWK